MTFCACIHPNQSPGLREDSCFERFKNYDISKGGRSQNGPIDPISDLSYDAFLSINSEWITRYTFVRRSSDRWSSGGRTQRCTENQSGSWTVEGQKQQKSHQYPYRRHTTLLTLWLASIAYAVVFRLRSKRANPGEPILDYLFNLRELLNPTLTSARVKRDLGKREATAQSVSGRGRLVSSLMDGGEK